MTADREGEDPGQEIRLDGLHSARGKNLWSRRPVIRMDLAVGAYEDISSADVPGFREALVAVLPGLRDHHCSIGAPGGFLKRLKQGTYAPHVIEHVALELQSMLGHEVGFGKTRGGEEPGEYTLVFEYRHEQVGLRSAAVALEIVQQAFAGTLTSIDAALDELRAMDQTPDSPPLTGLVHCGVTGGSHRHETQTALSAEYADSQLPDEAQRIIVDVSPSYILKAGLPYAYSEMAVITDVELTDVAERYRDAALARELVGTIIDGVRFGGYVILPAREWELQDYARDQDCHVAIFSTEDALSRRDQRVASVAAHVEDGEIYLDDDGDEHEPVPLDDGLSATAQVIALLSAHLARSRSASGAERG